MTRQESQPASRAALTHFDRAGRARMVDVRRETGDGADRRCIRPGAHGKGDGRADPQPAVPRKATCSPWPRLPR